MDALVLLSFVGVFLPAPFLRCGFFDLVSYPPSLGHPLCLPPLCLWHLDAVLLPSVSQPPLFPPLIACDRQKSFVLAGFRTLFRVQWIDISFYHHNHCICVCVVRPFELREKQFGSLPSEGDLLTPPSPRSFPTSCFYLLWLPSLPPSFVALVALFHPRFPLLLYETVFPAGLRPTAAVVIFALVQIRTTLFRPPLPA